MPGTTATVPSPVYQTVGTIGADTVSAVTAGGYYLPGDQGLAAWAYDPALVTSGSNTVSGTVYLVRVPLRYSTLISKVMISVTSAAASVTANQNYLGIYDSTGSRVAVTAAGALDTLITSSGALTATLSSSVTLAAGFYWVGFVNNATTPTQVGRMGTFSSTPNANLTQANYRFAVNGTTQTSLPTSITPSSNTSSGNLSMWAAIL